MTTEGRGSASSPMFSRPHSDHFWNICLPLQLFASIVHRVNPHNWLVLFGEREASRTSNCLPGLNAMSRSSHWCQAVRPEGVGSAAGPISEAKVSCHLGMKPEGKPGIQKFSTCSSRELEGAQLVQPAAALLKPTCMAPPKGMWAVISTLVESHQSLGWSTKYFWEVQDQKPSSSRSTHFLTAPSFPCTGCLERGSLAEAAHKHKQFPCPAPHHFFQPLSSPSLSRH